MSGSSSSVNRLELSLEPPPHDGQSYVPGDLLKGAIILHSPLQAAGVEASINFAGTSIVRFKEKGRLFSPVHTHEDELASWSQANLPHTKLHDRLIWLSAFLYLMKRIYPRRKAHRCPLMMRNLPRILATRCRRVLVRH